MARIREYEQQTSAGGAGVIDGRRATAEDFAGPGLTQLGAATMDTGVRLQEVAERAEVSDVQAKLAQARAEWAVKLQERANAADPGDVTFADKFKEDFSKHLQTLEGGTQTRAGQIAFQKGAARLSAHFVERAGIYQANAVGEKARVDYLTALNARQVELVSDPTQFQDLYAAALADLKDPTGPYAKMPMAKRQELEVMTGRELAKSAVQGLIQSGAPELAKRQLQDGKWDTYLDADVKTALVDKADVGIRAKDAATERARLDAERVRKETQDKTMSSMLARIVDPQAEGGPLSDREILSNRDLTALQQQHMIDYKLRRSRELAAARQEKSNPAEVRRLLLNIHAATDDPKKTYNSDEVMESYRLGNITTPEMTFLRREVDQLRSSDQSPFQKQVQAARASVNTMFSRSILGQVQPDLTAAASYNFMMDLDKAIAAKRAENKDPRVLLDPAHAEYMLKPERISAYLRPAREAMAAEAGAARAGASGAPPIGTIKDGYRFKGGNPADMRSWEKVQ